MQGRAVRVLLLADTHLGFDAPLRPRVERRRRGPDFFANFERALEPALRGEVDLVVHGGDLLFRSRVSSDLVQDAMAPLMAVAELGVPVFLAPGNHERSRIPYPLLAQHPRIFLFDRPRVVRLTLASGVRVAVAGFPFVREVRDRFRGLLGETGYRAEPSDVTFLVMHQAVEGAQVGARDFTFRGGQDVVRARDVPGDVAAVLSGHIHRAQTLTRALRGGPLAAPVVYPGSIERTSFAERHEIKGYVMLEAQADGSPGGRLDVLDFVPLPTRPMVIVDIEARGLCASALERAIEARLSALQVHAVVQVRLHGPVLPEARRVASAANVRALAPPSMEVRVVE
jgi:DNA repair protein SbcD/Mre11